MKRRQIIPKRNIEFVAREYVWGWSVWIKVNGFKTLLADGLKNKNLVYQVIETLPNHNLDIAGSEDNDN